MSGSVGIVNVGVNPERNKGAIIDSLCGSNLFDLTKDNLTELFLKVI
ncbi:MAG: hypothetical protein AB3N12_03850 [Ruegeria sp.]